MRPREANGGEQEADRVEGSVGRQGEDSRSDVRAQVIAGVWLGFLILALAAAWLIHDQLTASHVQIVNDTSGSVRVTLLAGSFERTLSVAPSTEEWVRLPIRGNTLLWITARDDTGSTSPHRGECSPQGMGQRPG